MFVRALNWLVNVGEPIFFVYLAVCIFILLPMAMFRRTRTAAGVAIIWGTWLSGAILWITSIAILYNWGWTPIILGLVLGGIGVIPIAWVLSLWNCLPNELGDLAILTAGTILPRLLVIWLIVRSDDKSATVPTTHSAPDL